MSGKRRATGSDLKKIDAYVLTKRDYDEIPELTEEDFARGVWHIGGVRAAEVSKSEARHKPAA